MRQWARGWRLPAHRLFIDRTEQAGRWHSTKAAHLRGVRMRWCGGAAIQHTAVWYRTSRANLPVLRRCAGRFPNSYLIYPIPILSCLSHNDSYTTINNLLALILVVRATIFHRGGPYAHRTRLNGGRRTYETWGIQKDWAIPARRHFSPLLTPALDIERGCLSLSLLARYAAPRA